MFNFWLATKYNPTPEKVEYRYAPDMNQAAEG
jgi:hypothetical protein